ncbi:MAG TPA: amidohydrolase family protein, partial [Arenimonas sp.]|nr:amidohydrolase family protein [Arenimonas sp.]
TAHHNLLTPTGREVLARHLSGGRIAFKVNRAADIRQTLAFAKRHGIRPIIVGGAEAWVVADELAQAKASVFVDPLVNLPGDFDQLGARLDNAALLHSRGVAVGFSQASDASHQAGKIRQLAGNAVANGLPWEAALAGLTSVPAEAFGVADRIGRIAVGQLADLTLWSGDPLEVNAVADQIWMGGKAMPMRSRQTELRDRYLREAGALPRAYPAAN